MHTGADTSRPVRRALRSLLHLPVICLLLTSHVLSGSLYVTPGGDDRHSGMSRTEALRSINRAVAMAGAGDTVFILPGTYRELITLERKHGAPEKPICLVGLARTGAEYPVIDGGASAPSSTASSYWMTIRGSSWIEVAWLAFRNGWTSPIQVDSSSYLTFRECRFFGGKRVIDAHGARTHHILVERCFWDQGGDYLWRLERDSLGVDGWTSMHHGTHEYFNGSLIDINGTGGSLVVRHDTIVNAFNAIRYRGRKGFDTNIEIYGNSISRCNEDRAHELFRDAAVQHQARARGRVIAPAGVAMAGFMGAMALVPLLPAGAQVAALYPLLALIGASGGLILIPCESFIQVRPAQARKGAVWAAANGAIFAGIVVASGASNLLNRLLQPTLSFAVLAASTIAFVLWIRRALAAPDGRSETA